MDSEEAKGGLDPIFNAIAADGAIALGELGLRAGAAVLDVGTGAGYFAAFLAQQGFDVLTGEPETDETHYAGKDWALNAQKAGVQGKVNFRPFDASAMPFDNDAFGAVFFFGVLHHVEEGLREAVMREALRVAQKSGPVVIFEPRQEMLEKVWVNDPGHPVAAHPAQYLAGAAINETCLQGAMMDIYIYR